LTRREILKGAAVGVGALAAGAPALAAKRDRVAVIGAGAGGVAAAYFLAGTYDVDVFEARSRIGGHCDSRTIEYKGHPVTVDLGAQFFHPDTHPLYVTLLEELGLYDPAKPDSRQTHVSPGSLCVFPVTGGGPPRFTSTHPLDTLPTALEFASFTQLARQAVLDELAWETTVDEWIASLDLDAAFKRAVLYPWITATIGCSRADAARVSARSILQTFALAFPPDPTAGATTYTSRIGLQGNLQRLLERVPAARVHRNSPVRALSRSRDGWTVRTPAGKKGPYRYVVINAPPRISSDLLRPLPALRDVTALLDRYSYFDSRLLIHRDPAYAYRDRAYWTAYNAGVEGRECEGSAWIGALHDPLPSGATVDVFKSWAQRRRADPRRIVLERRFEHPLITPRAIAAARALRPLQGRRGLYFSGAFTTGSDLQETALYSAMKVAEAVAPSSRTLASLQRRMRANGIKGLSYDL
jgi:predicted NAD/FAD-binding protein